MARIPKAEKWTLADLADLELLLVDEKSSQGARRIYRESVSEKLSRDLEEGERRRRGLRLWLEHKRGGEALVGQRIESGLRLAGLVIKVLALIAGFGIARGLLLELPSGGRGYNIWLFLGATLGLQWILLLLGGFGFLFFRRKGRLSIGQELLSWLGRKFAGSQASPVWTRLLGLRSDGYGSVLGWRLAGLTQLGAVWLNLGMVIGFLACLWFLKVHFYWESTLENLSKVQLVKTTESLSLPWSWVGDDWAPGEYEVARAALEEVEKVPDSIEVGFRDPQSQRWMRFFVLSLLVWGVLPRALLYYVFTRRQQRALAGLDFQESRHRNLWREMAKVERTVVKTTQADGVVLLDVGGSGLQVESVRPFLLQQLRVNPERVYQTGVLDASREEEALAAMKEAELGVVLVVEGWSLSGPQMQENYQKVRTAIGDKKPIRFVVVGTVDGASITEVNEVEMAEWVKFVDGLRDPAVEVVRWEG